MRNFTIESSTDGRIYTGVATEPAKGNQYNNYERPVAIPPSTIVYYRLKVTDIDGRFYYGPVVIVRMDNINAGFSFLNNPAKGSLNIQLQDKELENTLARIINSQGLVIQRVYLTNSNEIVDIRNLAPGMYVFETIKGSKQFIIK